MFNSLQILRAFAAWLVVYHHFVQSYLMGDTKDVFFYEFVHAYGSLGVDIFFVLSGVVMALVANKYKGAGLLFGINRVFRVVPVYWFYTLLLVISILLLPEGSYLTWWEDDSLTKSLLFVPHENPNEYGHFPTLYVGWTLIYELFFYMVFAAVLVCRVPFPAASCALLLIVISLATRDVNFLGHSSLLLLEFSLGIFIFEITKTSLFRNFTLIKLLCIGFFFLALLASLKLGSYFSQNAIFAGLVVLTFLLSENLFSKKNHVNSFLKSLGNWSYSTYLNHVIIIGWFYAALGNRSYMGNELVALIGITIVVAAVSKLSFHMIESNKFINRTKQSLFDFLTKNIKTKWTHDLDS